MYLLFGEMWEQQFKIKEVMTDYKIYVIVPIILVLYMVCGSYSRTETACGEGGPTVETQYGQIAGTRNFSRNHRLFYSFRGIPYAKPPIGDLRFKAPERIEPWGGILDGTKDANICLQKNYLFSLNPEVEGSEDCLYLNVYTPKDICGIDSSKTNLLPVMVFIHYGGFIAGSSRSTLLGPEYLMDKNVIFVSFNYRLGIFGFYSTLDDAAAGNWAFKDQVAALRWVHENIVSFGGDKNAVTIFGQSAGAGSVHHHILSPSSAGLFHRAISESGTALALWAKPFNDIQKTVFRAVAQVVACSQEDTRSLVKCMRNVDAKKLVSSIDAFKYFSIEPLTVFSAVIEEKTKENPEPFLTEEPLKIIESGSFQKVPWIIGVTSDEGMLRVSPLLRQKQTLKKLNANFDVYSPQMLLLTASTPQNNTGDLWDQIKQFYIQGNSIDVDDKKAVKGFIDLYSDRAFKYNSYQSALYHSYKGHSPIWFYNFNYKGKLSYGNIFAATAENIDYDWGVSHCDELLYLFPSPEILPELPTSDLIMSKTMVKLWTNFAIYGHPTPPGLRKKRDKLGWESIPDIEGVYPIKNRYLHFLNITGPTNNLNSPIQLEMRNDFLKSRMSFWENMKLYENIPGLE